MRNGGDAIFQKNCWYAIGWGIDVGREILARTVCNQRIIMFRTEDGAAHALEDRCCHRHLPLSKGKLVGDRVQCGYHGLEFDGDGKCLNVPGQSAIPPGAGVRGFPLIERYGLLWVWLGEAEKADEAEIPVLETLADPAWTAKPGSHLKIACDYRLLNDNLMDLGHETFVHATSIGHEVVAGTPIKTTRDGQFIRVERWMLDHDPAPFWKMAMGLIGYEGNVDRWQQIRFAPPCNYVLFVGVAPPGTGAPEGDKSSGVECNVISINTPETDKTCWQFWTFARNFRLEDAALSDRIHTVIEDILLQDIDVLNAQQDSIDANEGTPGIDINHDSGGLQARRLLAEMIEAEQGAAQQAAE